MEAYKILTYPDPFLKIIAKPVTLFDEELQEISERMIQTMYEGIGVGLAATQVGVNKRLFVMDVSYNKDLPESERNPIVVINPKIIEKADKQAGEEGCLSVPEFRADVERYRQVKLQYRDLKGDLKEMDAEDLAAVCIQHEIDHLKGKLFIDYLPPLQRNMIKKKLKKRVE
ncbi:peptide deformylase [bacterium]|nr:peptide deformylase [bacterium]